MLPDLAPGYVPQGLHSPSATQLSLALECGSWDVKNTEHPPPTHTFSLPSPSLPVELDVHYERTISTEC